MSFFADHWAIALAALSIMILLWWMNGKREALLGYREIDPPEAVAMINREDAVPVDVRDPRQFRTGHIQGARNHPTDRLIAAEDALKDFKDHPLIICCEHGITASRAASYLSQRGFRVYKLRGGLSAWRSAGLPLSGSKG
ncbi:MAG: rhodanese-like domain-containing protein [Gammaproteobacteria bacterium]|nr:rhodanese-like domain-containing protein [Gammaproteobacteria bacterium]